MSAAPSFTHCPASSTAKPQQSSKENTNTCGRAKEPFRSWPDSQCSSPYLFIAILSQAIKGTGSRIPSFGLVSYTQKPRPKPSPPEFNMFPSLTRVSQICLQIAQLTNRASLGLRPSSAEMGYASWLALEMGLCREAVSFLSPVKTSRSRRTHSAPTLPPPLHCPLS